MTDWIIRGIERLNRAGYYKTAGVVSLLILMLISTSIIVVVLSIG
jgi:hypothetical protein